MATKAAEIRKVALWGEGIHLAIQRCQIHSRNRCIEGAIHLVPKQTSDKLYISLKRGPTVMMPKEDIHIAQVKFQ